MDTTKRLREALEAAKKAMQNAYRHLDLGTPYDCFRCLEQGVGAVDAALAQREGEAP